MIKSSRVIRHHLQSVVDNFFYENEKYLCYNPVSKTIIGFENAKKFNDFEVKFVHSVTEFLKVYADFGQVSDEGSNILTAKEISAVREEHNQEKL